MEYTITHSLLSSWLYSLKENLYADATMEDSSKEDFLRVLRREPTPTTEAMQNGIDFENLVTAIVNEDDVEPEMPWADAASQIAEIIKKGQLQLSASKHVKVHGMEILLYGRLDALKAGQIFDIKFSKSYNRGKYIDSTQHPMYLELIPEAENFTYLISDGNEVWTEKYRRDETPSIIPIIYNFLDWLEMTGNMETYKKYWASKK